MDKDKGCPVCGDKTTWYSCGIGNEGDEYGFRYNPDKGGFVELVRGGSESPAILAIDPCVLKSLCAALCAEK